MFAVVDDEDYERIARHRWRFQGRPGTPQSYAVCNHAGRYLYMHRLIVDAPPGLEVDHIDGNGLNNRRCNLRVCSRRDNLRNMRPRVGTSRFKGVSWNRGDQRWQAEISIDRRRKYLGRFHDEIEAALAYDEAARAAFGEFARLNFPDDFPTSTSKGEG